MLGEQIGEMIGRTIGSRVMENQGLGAKIEYSVQERGTIFGIAANQLVTFWMVWRPGGVIYGEGLGAIMTSDGDVANWKANTFARLIGTEGAISLRGTIFCETATGGLSPLLGKPIVFEVEIDEGGNSDVKMWEWK